MRFFRRTNGSAREELPPMSSGSEATSDLVRTRLEHVGLGERADALLDLALPSVLLESSEPEPGIRSRLRGLPDLPQSAEWPRTDDVPLAFIAQIDLAETRSGAMESLPADGMLSFFYEAAEQGAWGFDPADRDKFAVIFTTDPGSERQAPSDLPSECRFPMRSLRPSVETTYAPWESRAISELGLTRDEMSRYAEALAFERPTAHRLLGHPDMIQGEMQLECQLASNGLYVGNPQGYEDPRVAELETGADDWMLLLQVDSDDAAQMMWGDVGRLYYWIRKQDLAARRFEQAWMVLQCS